jgi:hypothetical protein
MTANLPYQLKEVINYKEFRGTAFVQARFQQTLVAIQKAYAARVSSWFALLPRCPSA